MAVRYLYFTLTCIWLLACALADWHTGRVPNALTLPVFVGGVLLTTWRAITQGARYEPIMLVLLCALFYAGWVAHWYGGGDAKLRMTLAALWPHLGLLIALLLSAIFAGVVVLITNFQENYPVLVNAASRAFVGLSSGQMELLRSDREELHRLGQRGTWEIAIGGIGYAAYVLFF